MCIFIISTISLYFTSRLSRFINKVQVKQVIHRKVKRKRTARPPFTTAYIGQKVRNKPQRIGRRFSPTPNCKSLAQAIHKQKKMFCKSHPALLQNRKRLIPPKYQKPAHRYIVNSRKSHCKHRICYSTSNHFKFDTDSFLIGIDNHSSMSISNKKSDFIGKISPCEAEIKSFGGNKLKASGTGTVEWKILDDVNNLHVLRIHDVLYVPQAHVRLLCPQQWAQQVQKRSPSNNGTFSINYSDKLVLYWNDGKSTKTIPWSSKTNTAYMRTAPGFNNAHNFMKIAKKDFTQPPTTLSYANSSSVIENDVFHTSPEQNDKTLTEVSDFDEVDPLWSKELLSNDTSQQNTVSLMNPRVQNDFELQSSDDQAELLRWHQRLSHLSFKRIKLLALLGILPRRLATTKSPKCLACIYGSMTRKPWRTKGNVSRIKPNVVSEPGACISVDQMESSIPGFIAQLKGRLTRSRYRVATIFVDHASRMGYIHLQKDLTSASTLEAKLQFEAFARKCGVTIKHYHCDNGRFADNVFKQSVDDQGQTISYCGVNAHFQNGIAEKRIRDLQEKARTMLVHAKTKWPHAITPNLWPYALREACHVMNEVPDDQSMSSKLERFTSVAVAPQLKHFHPLFCPVYALNNRLQSGGRIPKWNARARLGIHLGRSPRHARNVHLVLNTSTGLVSPQYHVEFDDYFETVRQDSSTSAHAGIWQRLSGLHHSHNIPQIHYKVSSPEPSSAVKAQESTPNQASSAHASFDQEEVQELQDSNLQEDFDTTESPSQESQSQPLRRSTRIKFPTAKAIENARQGVKVYSNTTPSQLESYSGEEEYYFALHQEDYSIQDQMSDPISFLAKTDADTMYLHQAMAAPDRENFKMAIMKEIADHCRRKHWIVIPRSQVPKEQEVLPAVWSMKRKRDLVTRLPYKHKARINIHGGKQEFGVNFYETFSPVVNWTTIRITLIFSLINGWYSRQIDFVLAFPQAPIEFDMYMEIPKGVEVEGGSTKTHVLKLLKNLYGLKQAARQFYLHLKKGMIELGFEVSRLDECLFYSKDVLFMVYVDDGIIYSKSEKAIDELVTNLGKLFDVEDKGDVNNYLGIHFSRVDDGFHLTQSHLIDQLVEDIGLKNKHFKSPKVPTHSTKILQRHKDEPDFDQSQFHYRSVVGKLNYLEKNSRPDIAYAVHQLARFSSAPKISHREAAIYLIKYLHGTREMGLVFKPDTNQSVKCFVDADFCGCWDRLTAVDDPSTAKSRSGFIITYARCPIHWSSKLQTTIALSTTEAEYVAMSNALREVIPFMALLEELHSHGWGNAVNPPRVFCKVFEDNSGALEMIRVPKMRPRTKHINIIYHHFREFVRSGKITAWAIPTESQPADIFTKPLPVDKFVKFRKMIMNW